MESSRKTNPDGANPKSILALIVDDETGAINTLKGMLQSYCPQVQIGAAATSVAEATEQAQQLRPDLVFLDIEMPPVGSGFDFLKNCTDLSFGVIFTTAYPEYAIQAINTIQPWAYLVKPYSVAQLKQAVEIAAEKLSEKMQQGARSPVLVIQDSRKGALVLQTDKIVYCKAGGSFTDFFVDENGRIEKVISSRNLGEHIPELPTDRFCRTHHGYLVNLNYVARLERTGRNGIIHFRFPGHRAYVSVARMEAFLLALEQFSRQE